MVIFVVISYYAYHYENSIKNKKSIGATAPETVKQAIKLAEQKYL